MQRKTEKKGPAPAAVQARKKPTKRAAQERTPARQSQEPAALEQSGPRVDWALWTSMPDLMVWHAAALAVGLDPDSLRFHRESDFAGPSGPLFDSASFPAPAAEREFERALRLLHVAVITPDGPLQVKAPSAFGKPRESRIDLREAVAFLAGKGWALPTELRAHTEQEEAASAAAAPSELRWTPDRLEELKTYRKQHGTKNAAEHFCISEGRVRQLLPGSKREPAARTASNPFGMAASKKR